MKHIEVVAAVVIANHRILCVQRNKDKYDYISYKYEFPGGKVEKGETLQQALQRELHEELDLDITIEHHFLTVEHMYPDFKISLHGFICHCDNPKLTLNEHLQAKWMPVDLIATLDWADADIPIVDKIIEEAGELEK